VFRSRYAQRTAQNRFVLTDYLESVAFRIDHAGAQDRNRQSIIIAGKRCSESRASSGSKDPTERGPRHAVCFEGFEALVEHGIVDPAVSLRGV
jgi:hypothetical protein